MNSLILDSGKGWIAIDKPTGLPSHATNQEEDDALAMIRRELKNNPNLADKSGWNGFETCVHRLDRETSGVLLIAVDRSTASVLQSAFGESRTVSKTYRAVLRGKLSEKEGQWRYAISDKSEGRTNPQGKAEDRKPSETRFKVSRANNYFTEIEVDLLTGRQHQIRKHSAISKHAVVGDARYGDKKYNEMIFSRYGFSRMLLHAEKLMLQTGEFNISITAKLPREFDLTFGVEQ